jgi:hypothetical protein
MRSDNLRCERRQQSLKVPSHSPSSIPSAVPLRRRSWSCVKHLSVLRLRAAYPDNRQRVETRMEVPADKPAAGGASDVFFVLEKATLEVAKVGKARVCRRAPASAKPWQTPWLKPPPPTPRRPAQEYVLLNCDDHKNFLMKHNKDPADYRPDIIHQVPWRLCACSRPPLLRR